MADVLVEDQIEEKVEQVVEQQEKAEQVEEAATEEPQESLVITLGDEPKTEEPSEEEVKKAAPWIRDLRTNYKKKREEAQRLEAELREVKSKLNASVVVKEPELPPEPHFSDPDIDFDEKVFEKRFAEWTEKKIAFEAHKKEKEDQTKKEIEAWNAKLSNYQKAKAETKLEDYDEAESIVKSLLNEAQQGIIVDRASNPAYLVYALGKNETELRRLASMKTNLAEFTWELAKLEEKVKVTKRPSVGPERRVSGSVGAASSDQRLEELREEAARTKDFSKVTAYKNELRNKKK